MSFFNQHNPGYLVPRKYIIRTTCTYVVHYKAVLSKILAWVGKQDLHIDVGTRIIVKYIFIWTEHGVALHKIMLPCRYIYISWHNKQLLLEKLDIEMSTMGTLLYNTQWLLMFMYIVKFIRMSKIRTLLATTWRVQLYWMANNTQLILCSTYHKESFEDRFLIELVE